MKQENFDLNQFGKAFENNFVEKDYAVDTLINGNISECWQYLKKLMDYGQAGRYEVHNQLIKIKEQVPERYEYIKEKVFF